MLNLTIALEACGATFNDLVKLNINLLQGQDAREGFAACVIFFCQKYLKVNSPSGKVFPVLSSTIEHRWDI